MKSKHLKKVKITTVTPKDLEKYIKELRKKIKKNKKCSYICFIPKESKRND